METQKNSFTPKELVYKHIYDPNHVVTEEDLKNLKVGVFEKEASYTGLDSSSQKQKGEKEYLIH